MRWGEPRECHSSGARWLRRGWSAPVPAAEAAARLERRGSRPAAMPSYDQYMSVLCRTDEGAKVCAMNGLSTDVNIPYGGITKYSADGSLLAAARAETVAVVNAMTGESVCEIRCHRVSALAFSPNNTFLLCWSKPNKDEKNLNMFKLADGSEATPCFSVFQKVRAARGLSTDHACGRWPTC